MGEIAMVSTNQHPSSPHQMNADADADILHVVTVDQSFEHVLANINKLNRSLEAVVAVRSLLS